MNDITSMLTDAGVKPTSNRVLVMRALVNSLSPLSLGELETLLESLERSSILRVLTVLRDAHVIHDIEDGKGVIKYEPCSGRYDGKDRDMHAHFYCEKCQRVICFEDIPVPQIVLPDDYVMHSVNYMIKGICRACRRED